MSEHAFSHWHEYTCPLRTPVYAFQLLEHVIALAGVHVDEPPSWLSFEYEHNHKTPVWWLIAGDYAFMLRGAATRPVVVTVVARGMLPRTVRAYRNHVNALERRRRADRRRTEGARGGARARRREARAPQIDDASPYTPA